MAKITIIDGNDEIELSTAPKVNIKAYMVKGEPGSDGTSPTASISKSGDITTITVTDKNGTTEADVLDGYNPTVTASKTNKVTTITINDINGTATTTINDGIDLTGGVPTNGVIGFDGSASEIPDGYEVTTDPFGVTVHDSYSSSTTEPYSANYINNNSSSLTVHDSYSSSTTEPYSANYINGIVGRILWTNHNATIAFGPQTINLSSNDYDILEFYYKSLTGSDEIVSSKTIKGHNANLQTLYLDGTKIDIVVRKATYINDTSYSISTGNIVQAPSTSNTFTTNVQCIPLYVIGYKTGLFS